MRKLLLLSAVLAIAGATWASLATADPAIPPNWHVHDGQIALGPQHKGIGFFPTVLGLTTAQYLQDPAQCPDATDKAFLPQGRQDGQPLRAGVCMTSTTVIHLHTVPTGTSGPDGWSSIVTGSEPGWVTYYRTTSR